MRLMSRFTLVFGALAAKALVSFAIVFFALHRTEHHIARANLAHAVYERYLQLSEQSALMFKRLTDDLLLDETAGRDAEHDLMQAEIRATIDSIRDMIAAEIELVGEEEIEELALLTRVERSLYEAVREFRRLPRWRARSDPRYPAALASILEGGAYLVFREAIGEALAGEAEEVAETEAEAAQEILLLRALALAAFIAGLTAAAAALRSLRRDLMGPVERLQSGAGALGAGDVDHRIPETGPLEFAALAAAFNAMAAQIGARERDLAASRDGLEAQVAARTASLEEALARLAEADRLRRRLLSDVSHELRTTLTIIRGEAEFALRGREPSPEAYREALERTRDAAIHCARVVDDLLYVARAEEGAVRLTIGAVDLAPLLAENAAVGRSLVGGGCGARFESALATAVVRADRQRLRQVILILLENALRHGGGDVLVSLERRGAEFVVSVSDRGPGMAAEDIAAAFDRFHRGPDAASRHPRGSGLGLSVARAVIEAHGGRIGLDSAPGQGTTAWFALAAQPSP
jgi:signal transduction histidine kinase